MTTPIQAEINAAIERLKEFINAGYWANAYVNPGYYVTEDLKTLLNIAKEVEQLRKHYEQVVSTFHHMHINNQKDDACAKCGLDLRHEVHLVYEGK